MKKIYSFFFLFTVVSFFYSMSFIGTEVIKSAIPSVHSSVMVETVDGQKNNQEIFQKIAHYAREKQVSIHKLIFRIGEDGQTKKEIYTFDKIKNSTYSYPVIPSDYPTFFYDYSELTNEEVLGLYLITEAPPKDMKEELHKNGIEVEIEQTQWFFYFASMLSGSIGQLFFILFLCLIVALGFYKSSIRKKIGIREMLGCPNYRLILRDIGCDVGLFAGILGAFLFFYPHMQFLYGPILIFGIICIGLLHVSSSYFFALGTITRKIKGEKPYTWLANTNLLLKAMIMVCMILNVAMLSAKMTENKILQEQLNYWTQIPDYYHLQFSNSTQLLPNFKQSKEQQKENSSQINQLLLPLIEKGEQSGGVFLSDLELMAQHPLYNYVDKNALWVANHNAVRELNVKDRSGNVIQRLEEHSFHLLIPENKRRHTSIIVKEIEKDLNFYQHPFDYESTVYQGELNILYTQSNQVLFNYNHQLWENMYAFDPVIVVISLPLIEPNIDSWIADISNGTYLFRESTEVQHFIQEHQLQKEFFGLIAVKDQINETIVKNRFEYYTAVITWCFLITSFVAIEGYSSMVYIQMNSKRLFLKYIFGKTLWQRHRDYYLKMSVSSFVVLSSLSFWRAEWLASSIAVAIFEMSLLLVMTYIAEKKQRLEVIKND
ncbi:MAG TPA: DUF1430 domain-containing protein [Enterococcus durans]|nr:DUF1430 domain-containing protein [Enterococcus durans]